MKFKSEYSETFKVEEKDCISDINSLLPSVLGTYTIVKWMEIVSAKLINYQLDCEKYITMGKEVSIEHLGMVKLGEKVMVTSQIIEQNKKEVQFSMQVMLGEKEIAKASHLRVIIPVKLVERMMK